MSSKSRGTRPKGTPKGETGPHRGVSVGVYNATREQLEATRKSLNGTQSLIIAMIQQFGEMGDAGMTVTLEQKVLEAGSWSLEMREESDGKVTLTLSPAVI